MERAEGSPAPTGPYGPGGGFCGRSLGPFSGELRESFPHAPRGKGGSGGEAAVPAAPSPSFSPSPAWPRSSASATPWRPCSVSGPEGRRGLRLSP